jgi:NACalpha-BTF3-like transcription factor
MDIAGGASGPVGTGYVGAEVTMPIKEVAEISRVKMKGKDKAVFFIQRPITIRYTGTYYYFPIVTSKSQADQASKMYKRFMNDGGRFI